MQDQIICPKCKTPLTQALYAQMKEQFKVKFDAENKKNKELLKLKIEKFEQQERKAKEELQKKEDAIKKQNEQLKQAKDNFNNLVDYKVKEESKKIQLTAQKEALERAKSETAQELNLLKEQLVGKNAIIEDFTKQELELRKKTEKLEEEQRLFVIKKQRELDEAKRDIKEKAWEEMEEQHRLKDKEKDKKIEDLTRLLEEAQRKAHQGSQQLQGEVQELGLEEILRRSFPLDVIEPVCKGVKGADVRQIVKTQRGYICGVILWESKREQTWSDKWLTKLKDDLRAEKANIPIIVTAVFPRGENCSLLFRDGVWVCGFKLIFPLGEMVRQRLIDVAKEKFISQNRTEKAEMLYEYVTSHEFRQQVEAMVEQYRGMQEQIARERVAFEKSWKMRESQVKKLLISTAGIIGSMSGKIGSSMPQIKGLELLDSGKEEK